MKVSIANFLLTLSLLASTVFFLVIPLFGLSYLGAEDSPLYMITIISLALFSLAYITIYEFSNSKKASGSILPYLIPLIVVFVYLVECVAYSDMGKLSSKMINLFIANSVPSVFIANFVCRYNKLSEILKNFEIIAIISSLGLIYSLPSMYMMVDYDTSIGGGGGHQTISYGSAICFGYFFINTFSRNYQCRYYFLCNKVVYIFEVVLMVANAGICIIGGGRGGAVLLVINLILSSIVIFRKQIWKVIILSTISVASFYFLLSLPFLSNNMISEMFTKGMERSFSYVSDSGAIDMSQTSERDVVYQGLFQLIDNMPLNGYGFFHLYEVCQKSIQQHYPHNIFFEVLLQGGYLLFFVFCVIYAIFLKKIFNTIILHNKSICVLPLITYPLIELLFSGTYIKSALFWFVVIYILNQDKCDVNRYNINSAKQYSPT